MGEHRAYRVEQYSWHTSTIPLLSRSDPDELDDAADYDDWAKTSGDAMEQFRQALESSWDVKRMGLVPTDAKNAAQTAASAVEECAMSGMGKNIFFVNILVPQYDIDYSGAKLYDEVLAVEFCIALAQHLAAPSMLCVRDTIILKPVQRILNARAKSIMAGASSPISFRRRISEDPLDDSVTKPVVDTYNTDAAAPATSDRTTDSDDVKEFRAKLMADWKPRDDGTSSLVSKVPGEELLVDTAVTKKLKPNGSYRLTTLLGDTRSFSTNSTRLINEIIDAVTRNALPQPLEEYIILLAPSTKEEMIGVRALLQKYSGRKRFILVNSKLDPLPVELYGGETIYSVLPWIGKLVTQGSNDDSDVMPPPKVVLLRSYPRDWELYVDIGRGGFNLAASYAVEALRGANRITGPSMKWIQTSLKEYFNKTK